MGYVTGSTVLDALDTLEKAVPLLPPKDHRFANDLIEKGRKYRKLSDGDRGQFFWVQELIKRATTEAEPRKTVEIGSMEGVVALFDRAKQHLKDPTIVLASEDIVLRLRVASEGHRVPGSINVVEDEGRQWLGRIHRNGTFEVNRKAEDSTAIVTSLLKRFAAAPAETAKESSRLTGKCCFCNTALTDERSTNVGYGKVCASRYELPWG